MIAHNLDSIRPQLMNAATEVVYAEERELVASLRLTLMGTTSNLHGWDPQQEHFVLRGPGNEKMGILSIIGKDEIITHRSVLFVPRPAHS